MNPELSNTSPEAGKPSPRFKWIDPKKASYALLALSFLAAALGLLPGLLAALSIAAVLLSQLGLKRGLLASAAAAALILPAFQPVWTVFIAPVAAIACGVAAWHWQRASAWRLPAILGGICAYALALLVLTQAIIPALQPVAAAAYGLLPSLLLPLAGLSISGYLSYRLVPKISGVVKLAGVGTLLASSWLGTAAICYLNLHPSGIELQMRWSMNPESLSELPYTENDRILPRATGEYYVKDANNQTGFSTEAPHIVLEEGNLWWQSPLHNDRWYGRIFGSVPAVVRIDADKTDKKKEDTGNSAFIFGNQSWVLKSAFQARHLLSEPGAPSYYHRADKSWVMLVPCISKRPFWTGVMLPHVSGVMAVEQNGEMHDYSVSDAQRLFPGAVFFPPELAAKYSQAYAKWRGGFWETVIGQAGMMEISENESNDPGLNPQPYIINFKGLGLQETVCFEPRGEHQMAMIEVLMFDAASGKLHTYLVPNSVSLSGPRRCLEQVRSSDTQTDWSHRRTVEPRLTVSARGIFFLVTVTAKEPGDPHNQPYITSVIINASTLHSQRFQQPEALRKFLAEPAESK